VKNIREQYGKLITQPEVDEQSNVTGTFVNEQRELEKKSTFKMDKIKGKVNAKKFIGSKVGDMIDLNSKNLFTDDHLLMNVLGIGHDEAHDLDIDLKFTVEEITKTELAEMNKELFDKIYGVDLVKNEDEFIKRLKEDAEQQFASQSDQQLLNSVTESLIENTKFDLPAEFLKKWLAVSGEKPMTPEEAKEEYERSEKGLRYQLIEGKLMKDNELHATYEDLKEYTKGFVRAQMAQFGDNKIQDKELDEIVSRVLSNQQEVRRLSDQLKNEKLLKFFKENVKLKTKEVTYEEFIKEVYQ
jgi:trigger factor